MNGLDQSETISEFLDEKFTFLRAWIRAVSHAVYWCGVSEPGMY